MKKLILFLSIYSLTMLVGCTNLVANNPPKIAPMELSDAQQEIVNLLSHPGQEFLLFEYTDRVFTEIEIWVEVYHYGELLERYGGINTLSDTPMEAVPIAITINHPNRLEFQWSISVGGGRGTSGPWTAQSEYLARAFGSITEPVEIADGQEIILYISKFTTGTSLSTMNDLQHYIEYPEELADYTYVHIIKARFTKGQHSLDENFTATATIKCYNLILNYI